MHQSITFDPIPSQVVGTVLALSADASSGLAVTFRSMTPTMCTVSGTTASLNATGTCTILAIQDGNYRYRAARPVSQSFAMNATQGKSQTITFGPIAAQSVATTMVLSASASSGLPVTFASETAQVCTVSAATAMMAAAGTCTIQATQAGNGTYAAANPVTQSFTVNGASSGGSYNFPTGPTYSTSSGQHTLSRTIPWNPGIPGGVPQRTQICATLSATGNGDDSAINNALAACAANGVVLLKAGTYDIRNAIMIPGNVVLRGSGGPGVAQANQTRLMANSLLYGPVVNLGANLFPHATGTTVNLTGDALQGTSSANVASTRGFNAGDLVVVDMLVDPADDTGAWITSAPAGGTGLAYPYAEYSPTNSPKGSDSRGWFTRTNRPVAQIMEIQSISGNAVTFSTPFHMTFDVGHKAQMTAFDTQTLTNAGLENVYVSGVPAPGGNVQYNNIVFSLAKYSWVKNVESDDSNGYGIGIDESFRCVVRDSYIHSTINPTPGGAGYGLEFSFGSADNLAENNISWNFNKVMVMRASGGGNALAYNYMDDGWIAYQPNWVESGINAAHMTTPHFELFEGNLSFSLGSDDTWGGSIFITWLRNVATNHRAAWPPLNTYLFNTSTQAEGGCTTTGVFDNNCIPYTDAGNRAAAIANYGDDFFNYVGNVLGSSGMPVTPETQGFTYANAAPDWPSDPVPMWIVGFGDWNGNSAADQGVVNTVLRDGNYDYATNTVKWAGSPQTIPNSLYTVSKPAFFGNYSWPWSDGSNASNPYYTHSFSYYPLSPTFGTFGTSGTMASYTGYQLPAFVRFLQLHGIEKPPVDCASTALANMPADCSLLFTGVVPTGSLASQTIAFNNPGAQTVGTPLTLSATASSGLTVSFASTTTSACTVSATTATFIAPGTCTIQASQAGNSTYAAATPVSESFTINPAPLKPQTITFNNPGAQTVGTPLMLSATASSGLTVSFASGTTSVCTVSGTTVTFLAAGTCTIQASQAGNTSYGAATPVSQSFTVNAAPLKPQTITFNNPGAQTVGKSLALSATASSGLTIVFASQTTSVCTVSGTTATFLTAGTCTIQASQAGNSTYSAAAPVSQSFTVNAGATGGPLTISTTSCPGGTQGAVYAGCTISATGGTPPYTFSVDSSGNYPPLPEGMVLNASTGAIASAQIGGQGMYTPQVIVKDAASGRATKPIAFAISGSNAFLANIFPSTSIFHHRVDAATTGLPVDNSPAAPMYSGYLTEHIRVFFGNTSNAPFPNGIPAFQVPYNQPNVPVATTVYQSYFTSGPIPANAPIEGTSAAAAAGGDMHVLIYRAAGGGNPPALYEMWQGIYQGGPWTDSSNALWPDVTSNALTPQGNGTSDAAGLPVAPLLVNADEVIGTGTPTAPNGTVQHPIRFTLNHMLNYWVWPATETAGVGSCKTASGTSISTESMISQATPPGSCTMTGPAGETYRLKASAATPSCAATSPQAAILIAAFRNYGIILADNGMSGGLIGTPDSRWNDNDLQCLTSITLNEFEPVNVSSLMVNNDSGATSH